MCRDAARTLLVRGSARFRTSTMSWRPRWSHIPSRGSWRQASSTALCGCEDGVNTSGGIARVRKQETQMINRPIRLVALGTLLIALTGGPSLAPVFAAGGGGGGGGGGGDPYGGAYSSPNQPSSYPKRS